MSRTREYRIAMRQNKINRRKRLIQSHGHIYSDKINNALSGEKEGFFNKCHYGALHGGNKTKTKNAYASYRHKGGYGKSLVYSKHDKIQIIYMNQELCEYRHSKERGDF